MLTRCVAVAPEVFAAQYWGRRPLLSRSGALPRDFTDLLSPDAVDELITRRGVRAPFLRMAKAGQLLARDCYLDAGGFGAEMPDQVDSARVLAQLAAGATLVLQGLHRLWPPLIDFVRDAVDDLGHPVQANAYITPPDNQGFDPHYDVHDVFVLQVSGDKRWIVHEPVHTDPLPSQPWTDHRGAITVRGAQTPVIDTVLTAGDVLYLPRGWVHSARSGDTTSIHLTIGVSAMTGLDVLRAVVDALADDAEFRKSLPMGVDVAHPGETAAIASKVMAALTETVRDRGAELSDRVAARMARRHSERTRPVAVPPLATLDAAAAADTTRVRWRRGLVAPLESADGRVRLRLPDRTMSFPGFCAAALTALQSGEAVDASTLPGLDHHDGTVLLRRLLREAVVVAVAD
ncbi:cupin [Mycolicibacterium chubuense]|uniref:Cupin superfamily protein n=1 Tax=Mycolicibacterium chubuense TaxID=1800 RepID=A0A0J6WPH2_MYCCU|nr:cupin domain-containing protein [Mycolicibacterium chubuense]KMO83577.1 Cupin superfamily protein [Mycolicibacterium chubuense]ORA53986.1 cupin [Mycolicibacterium chubuense]SPX95503.1 cupin 4 family protein [Mycolicibacterium chubuense]